jgi:hypothetical protein
VEKNFRKYSSTWRMNNTFLNDQWVIEKNRGEIKKVFESNENENTTYQNLWNTTKAVLRGTFIAVNTYIKKQRNLN